MSGINSLSTVKPSVVNFKQNNPEQKVEEKNLQTDLEKDVVQVSSKKERPEPPQISRSRLFWGFLTDDQIKGINESGRLPENAKFVMNGFGSYTICNNFFGLRAGTRELPAGFEVRKSKFGNAVVLPKGMEGALIK